MSVNFAFSTTKNILCELGSSARIGGLFKQMGCKQKQTLLVVTDQGIMNAKLAEKCISGLVGEGFNVEVYSNVVADPPEIKILEALEVSKRKGAVGVIGFGGGSSMDVAKIVAFLSHQDCKQQLGDIYGIGQCVGGRLPLVQVPTTAGTGSEVTPLSIITTGANEKKGISSSQLLPDWAVLDGELTMSVPSHVTAATGIDAMVHAIEAYTSRIKKNPLSDLLAKEALRLLGENIRTVCSLQGAGNAKARGDMLLGSLYAGQAFANSPVGAVHALAYPIGSHFKVPHGLSNSIMLPHVIRFNAFNDKAGGNVKCAQYYSDLAGLAFPQELARGELHGGDTYEISEKFAGAFELLATDLDIPKQLREVGVKTSTHVELLASEAMKQTRLLPNNARVVTHEDALELYNKAL